MKKSIKNFHSKKAHMYHHYAGSLYILGLVLYLSMSFVKALLVYVNLYTAVPAVAIDTTEVVISSCALAAFTFSFTFHVLAMKHEGKEFKFSISKMFVLFGYIASSFVLLTSSIFLFYGEPRIVLLLDVIGYGIAIGFWFIAFFTNIFIAKKYPHNHQH